jgi:tetrapyrrole methylase family protein / MazG family protein
MSKALNQLLEVMARLRAQCPWDKEQTHRSLMPYLIEEAYEVIDTIEAEDKVKLKEELGDLLLQIVFHAAIATENHEFDFDDIVEGITAKLIRRHPHVFGEAKINTAEEVVHQWEAIKLNGEKHRSSLMDGMPKNLPALLLAQRVQSRAGEVGFDWKDISGPLSKLKEEIDELQEEINKADQNKIEEELGDLFFAMVNVTRWANCNAEEVLRQAVKKFITRFKYVEAKGDFSSLEIMDKHWEEAKKKGQEASSKGQGGKTLTPDP